MSDLQKQFMKKGPPPKDPAHISEEEEEDDMDEEMDSFDPDPTHKPLPIFPQMDKPQQFQMPPSKQKKKISTAFDPVSWEEYFDNLEHMPNGTSIYTAGTKGHVYIALHGAGFSAISFACLAGEIKKFATIAAFDFRGHGLNKMENEEDLCSDTLVKDSINVFKYLVKKFSDRTFIVVGHSFISLGGAIAAKAFAIAQNMEEFKDRLRGLIVIDVVEGTAIEALPFMESFEMGRQQKFPSMQEAIKYNIASGMIKNRISAKVSTPPTLIQNQTKDGRTQYVWRTNRMATKKYWHGWFKGMNQAFLDSKCPKILMTSEKGRMDKQFIIAQMQGKFRLQMFNTAGHSIQEDEPQKCAKSCYDLLKLFRIPANDTELSLFAELGIGKFKPQLDEYP